MESDYGMAESQKLRGLSDIDKSDFLAIEVFTFTPHLEASGEICMEQLSHNNGALHCFIDVKNPDNTFAHHSSWYSKKNKVMSLHKVIRKKGVETLYLDSAEQSIIGSVEKFANIDVKSQEQLRALKYKDANLGIGVLSSLISKTRDSNPDIYANKDLIKTYLRSTATVYEYVVSVIEKVQPKKVMVFNGRLACSKAISEAARRMGVSVVYHERGATEDRYQLVDMPIHNLRGVRDRRDSLWASAGEGKEEIAKSFFTRKRMGDGIGWLSFTQSQVENKSPKRVAARRLVYFSSSDDEFAAIEDAVEHKLFESQRVAIRWLINWASEQDDVELVIRIHPHLVEKSEKEREWWCALSGENVVMIPPEDETDSYALADSSDIVLSFNSTIGIEASYWGRPSIVLGDCLYSGLECVYEPNNISDLQSLLETRGLCSKPKENCLPYGYHGVSFGVNYKYFQSEGFFLGTFFGERLTYESRFHQILRRSKLLKLFGNMGKS